MHRDDSRAPGNVQNNLKSPSRHVLNLCFYSEAQTFDCRNIFEFLKKVAVESCLFHSLCSSVWLKCWFSSSWWFVWADLKIRDSTSFFFCDNCSLCLFLSPIINDCLSLCPSQSESQCLQCERHKEEKVERFLTKLHTTLEQMNSKHC